MENENIKQTKNTKPKKVGFKTLGIVLIIFGILFLLQILFKIDILRYMLMAWPALLIFLGIEIIFADFKGEVKVSVGSIFIVMLLICISFIFGACNIFFNEVMYTDEFMNSIVDRNYSYYLGDEDVNINNYTDKLINLKIIESDVDYNTVYVNLEYNFSKNNISNIFTALNNDFIDETVRRSGALDIYGISDNINGVNMTVVTNSKDKVKTSGNIIVLEN